MKLSLKLPVVAVLATLMMATLSKSSNALTLTHDYSLDNTFADSLGGPSLVGNGGALTSTGYAFGANQGLSISNGVNANDYSIVLDFNISNVSSYRRLVEFKNLTSDNGLYNLNSSLNFYPVATGPSNTILPSTNLQLVITRDNATSLFTGYVNGVSQLSFTDSGNLAVFNGPNNIAWFFQDDNAVGNEASPGFVDRIRIYDGALSASQVLNLPGSTNSVPVPPQFLATAVGAGLGALKLRRRQTKSL